MGFSDGLDRRGVLLNSLTYLHVVAGAGGLVSGAVASLSRKGTKWHRYAGHLFAATMVPMALSGAFLAFFKPEYASVVGGLLTAYLVATSWMAARFRTGYRVWFDVLAIAWAGTTAGLAWVWGVRAGREPGGVLHGFPPPVYFVFGFVAAFALLLDVRALLAHGLRGEARIVRHLWRMLTALLIAALSFFVGQMDELPSALQRIELMIVPPAAVLVYLMFCLFRGFLQRTKGRSRTKAGAAR